MRIAFCGMRFREGTRQDTSQITVFVMEVQVSTTNTSVGNAELGLYENCLQAAALPILSSFLHDV